MWIIHIHIIHIHFLKMSAAAVARSVVVRLVSSNGNTVGDPMTGYPAPFNRGNYGTMFQKEAFTKFKGGSIVLCVQKPSSDVEYTEFARGAIPSNWTPPQPPSENAAVDSNTANISVPITSIASGVAVASMRFVVKKSVKGTWLLNESRLLKKPAINDEIDAIPWVVEIKEAETRKTKRIEEVKAFAERVAKVARDIAYRAASADEIPDEAAILLEIKRELRI